MGMIILNGQNHTTKKTELSTLIKRFEKVVFKDMGSSSLSNSGADEIVSSFKLEPLEDVPEEEPVEFDVSGIDGSFGDGTDAKGDGMV